MQYGDVISCAFSVVWRHPYLWLLAILGGADVSGGFSGPPNPASFSNLGRQSGTAAGNQSFNQFLQDNLGLIVALAAIVLLVLVAWFVLSCVTTGALVRASAEHDAERPFRLGLAWRTGLGTFWSILGLRLIALVYGILFVAVIGLFVVLGILAGVNGQSGALAAVIAVGIVAVLAAIVITIAFGLLVILATRAIVLEQRGTIAALGRGFELFRARLGRVLLVWLIQVALAIGAGVVLAVPLVILALLITAFVVAAAATGGAGAALAVGIPFGLAAFGVLIVLGGLTGAYFSTYWTLAFRRMELDAPPVPAWTPPPYPPRQPV